MQPSLMYSQSGVDNDKNSPRVKYSDYLSFRGIEREENHGDDKFRSFLNILFFIPRKTIDGILFSSIYGARLLIGSKEIERADDFFLKAPKTLVWTPVLFVNSDFRPVVGLSLLYRKNRFGSYISGKYTAQHKWKMAGDITYTITKRLGIWKLRMSALIDEDDDRKYYGIGAEPGKDERSHFLPGNTSKYGIYSQRSESFGVTLGFRPAYSWELFISSSRKNRFLKNEGFGDPLIGDVVDLSRLEGGQSINQWYNELAFRFDTRRFRGRFSKGVLIDGYVGISNGVGEDKSRFLRSGMGLAAFFPVLRQHRFLVPRILFDMVSNLNDNVGISFTEYPHVKEFRGTSHRSLLRTDLFTLLPSLEYQWPLSNNFNAHLFFDYFMVARDLHKFSTGNGLWAVGLGFDYHTFEEEVIRIELITGSNNFRISFNFGLNNFSRRNLN